MRKRKLGRTAPWALLVSLVLAVSACTPRFPEGVLAPTGALLAPKAGTYFGVNLDWEHDSPAAFNARLGHHAAVFVRFFAFPLSKDDLGVLDSTVQAVAAQHAMLMITLEPMDGLANVIPASSELLADRLAAANGSGVAVFVRFAHEMNGSWYPWAQQPGAYVAAFRILATAVHARAPRTAMLWAPNYGGGYPFAGGQYMAGASSPDFRQLDTNQDGKLDMSDDPYGPYYPGDDAVDWVGMSLYHWGNAYPWGDNEIPEQGKFLAQLTGEYDGLNGDDRALPDFYGRYYTQHGKPVAITETAAFYDAGKGGPDELQVKQAWWRQVLDPSMLASHPGIQMINWFEWLKPESEAGGRSIDWRATASTDTSAEFQRDLPIKALIFAP